MSIDATISIASKMTIKARMEWYLCWLDKNERKPGEDKPVGIILCADKDQEDVEYLELNQAGIHVSQYLTELPPKELMEAKLHTAIADAKQQHDATLLKGVYDLQQQNNEVV